ncbi:UNVERIFIED_CONTAM: hypothetical protein GTU68_040001, partial [Idotea baltica]|nr:hypothetical protein [Idotea baltica]
IVGPADLASANSEEISFLGNALYEPQLATTRAAAVLVAESQECDRDDLTLLRVKDPSHAFTAVIQMFSEAAVAPTPGVHPTAVVDPTAQIDATASVGPLCVIGARSTLAAGVVLASGVHVGADVQLGANTHCHPRVVIEDRVVIGARCELQAGAVIGSEGFGYEPTAAGWERIPQCGTVILGDDVDVGANATIDRARFGATQLADMVKVDNLVQIAHNCVIGNATLLCAQVGLAGSVTTGTRVVMAGQSGSAGHIHVGDGVQVAGASGLFSDVKAGEKVGGWPARPMRESLRDIAGLKRLPQLKKELKELRGRIEQLEESDQ